MKKYYVIDHADDYHRLCRKISEDFFLLPLSADSYTSIPVDFPKNRIVNLSSLISENELSKAVVNRVNILWNALSNYENCPYYKVKQLLDSIIEKEIIVERLMLLDGKKYFIGQKNQWISIDGDNSESCRFAAIFMKDAPDFIEVRSSSRLIIGEYCLIVLRTIKHLFEAAIKKSSWREFSGKEVFVGNVGYGALNDFNNKNTRCVDFGSIIFTLLLTLYWVELWKVIAYSFPFKINPIKSEEKYFYIPLCREVIRRSNSLQRSIDRIIFNIKNRPLFFFTVNYGRLLDMAIVRSFRKIDVPIISMQHALVGHDRWSASQYLDLWESDIKLVGNQYVADSLKKFEENRRDATYLPVSIPMFRRDSNLIGWDGVSVAYIFTGFTRSNTMYDSRRINDSIYFERIRNDLSAITPQFSVSIMTHPYDKRQYKDRIGLFMSRLFAIPCIRSLKSVQMNNSIVIIDSPSTILADTVLSGLPVIIINRTSILSEDFVFAASKYGVLFKNIEDFISYQQSVDLKIFNENQYYFSVWFKEKYCQPSGELKICDAIENYFSVKELQSTQSRG
jgi:hypothetical protein